MIRSDRGALGCSRAHHSARLLHLLRLVRLCGVREVGSVAVTAVTMSSLEVFCKNGFGVVIGER